MNKKGVTLIELLVVITIMGLIFSMVYQNFFVQQRAMRRQRNLSDLNMKARKATHYLVNEIRQIGFSQRPLSPVDKFGIIDGYSDSLVYSHDRDGANAGVVDPEDVHRFAVSGDTLKIDGDRAIRFVDSIGFRYIDDRGNTVTPPVHEVSTNGNWVLGAGSNPVSRVEYTIRLIYPIPYPEDTIVYTNTAAIRNLRP